MLVVLAAVWGGGALSFYAVAAAHATDRCEPGQIAQVLSGMLFVWAGGSVIGPVLTGLAADSQLGQPGIFLVVAGAYFALTVINLWRVLIEDRPRRAQRTPYLPVAGLSVVEGVIAEQDPQVMDGGRNAGIAGLKKPRGAALRWGAGCVKREPRGAGGSALPPGAKLNEYP